jgi:Flp pilus assembly CpaF family ATPase
VPIKILDVPDPFTSASRFSRERQPLIESDAYRHLVHELRRYCSREIAGRSFLIAGHRGAGKTTLVSSALEALLRREHDPLSPMG